MDLRLDLSTGDLAVTEGQLTFVTAPAEQDVVTRLRHFLGEWFLDTTEGVPYFQRLLGSRPNTELINQLLREAILASPYIAEVRNLRTQYDGKTRCVQVFLVAATIDGGIIDTGSSEPLSILLL